MRIITSYACTLDVETAQEAVWRFNLYRGVMDDWLRAQGISNPREDSLPDTFVQLSRRDMSHDGAEIDGFSLKQPILESSHLLHTQFDLALSHQSLALFLQFSVERLTNRIAPASIQVGCPRALATILESGDWQSGQVRVRPHCRRIRGLEAGVQIRKEIADPNRTTPIVLLQNSLEQVSNGAYDGTVWADFVNRLEDDLGGVAQLVELDEFAADALIPPNDPPVRRGGVVPGLSFARQHHEWGMCGSIVRIVWPLDRDDFIPDRHPAWGPWENFYDVDDEDRYDYPIHYGGSGNVPDPWITLFRGHELMTVRSLIRDTIFEQAALQPVPKLIDDIRRRYATAERERLTASGDIEALEELYTEEISQRDQNIDSLQESLNRRERELNERQDQVDQKEATINQLRFQLDQLKEESRIGERDESVIAFREPTTVAEAIEVAKEQCTALSFGPRATDKLDSLSPKAGPPRRILSDLEILNQCGRLLQDDGSLGDDVVAWLNGQNVNVSKESSTRMNKHAAAFTFLTARDTHEQMGDHIKYRGGGLDREVRIHFRVHQSDDHGEAATIDVGYIGPKIMPD